MVNLPKIDPDIDYAAYADGLESIIPDKILALLAAMKKLNKKKEAMQKVVTILQRKGEISGCSVYFWLLLAELEYTDYYSCQQWLRYWLRLYEKIPSIVIPKKVQKTFDNSKKIQAKLEPIENHYDGQLKANGSRLIGLCPFHEEKTGSFFIYTGTNTFHCFGACKKGGDVIEYIMQLKKLTFTEAVNYLI